MVVVVSIGFVGSLIGASFTSVTGEGDIAVDIGAIANVVGCGGVFFLIFMDGSALVITLISNAP